MYRLLDGIEKLLRRAQAEHLLHRLIQERDALADALGIPLRDVERDLLRSVPEENLQQMIQSLGGVTGPLARPRPMPPLGRDTLTRGIRPID